MHCGISLEISPNDIVTGKISLLPMYYTLIRCFMVFLNLLMYSEFRTNVFVKIPL